jgi:hypothetical protein
MCIEFGTVRKGRMAVDDDGFVGPGREKWIM